MSATWSRRLYGYGLLLAGVLSVAGELIWIADPLRSGDRFWIDAIDRIVYLLLLIPLIWMTGALLGLKAILRHLRQASMNDTAAGYGKRSLRWAAARSSLVFVSSALSFVLFAAAPNRLLVSFGSMIAALLLMFIDLLFGERQLRGRRWPTRSLAVLGATLLAAAALFYPTPYMVTYPGLTLNMNRYAQAEGGTVHRSIAGLLVFERPAFPVDWLYAKLFPHYSFEPRENLGMSLGEYDELVRAMKQDANTVASAVAFQKAGLGRGAVSTGIFVSAIVKDSPAKDVLHAGDVIVAVGGQAVTSVQLLSERMRTIAPGAKVPVDVLRDGKRLPLTAGTRVNPDAPDKAAFGIQVQDKLEYDIPGNVHFHQYLAHEGGPSHGAMLALALIDQLTPGGVTNGNNVAGTGTIEPDGSVGEIGGAEQKAYTVSRSGADVFFVPAGNEKDARRGAPGLQIVPVKTLDDVLAWLKAHPKTPAS